MDISKEKKAEGQALADKHGFDKLWVNESGEFFTTENLAAFSVDNAKAKFAEVPLTAKKPAEKKAEKSETE